MLISNYHSAILSQEQVRGLTQELRAKIAQVRRHPVWAAREFDRINSLEGDFGRWEAADKTEFLAEQYARIQNFLKQDPP